MRPNFGGVTTEFKNRDFIEFCGSKGIKREYNNARTPQQNGVAERKNRFLIEAARTMLADSFLPNTFWTEVVSTACYVLNRVLVTNPHNKTPYELLTGKLPIISYIRPFGCHVTILNTIDHLGKFAGKSDKGFLVGKGPTWLFDLDYLTDSMNYHPVSSKNQANIHAGQQEANHHAGTEDIIDAGDFEKKDESAQDCFVLPIWSSYSSTINPDLKTDEKPVDKDDQVFLDELQRLKRQEKDVNDAVEALGKEFAQEIQAGAAKASNTNIVNTVSTPAKASSTNIVNTVSTPVSTASPHEGLSLFNPTNPEQDDSEIPPLKDIYQNSTDGIFTNSSYDDEGVVADFTNLETVVNVSPIPTSRIISSHPSALILGDPTSAVQTRSKVNKSSGAHAFVSYVQKQRRNNHKDFHHCLFACFLSQNEPKKISEALEDENLPYGKKAISTKWVYRNKKDERGVVVRNKARLVAQGHRQEEGIDYDEVFALVARIESHKESVLALPHTWALYLSIYVKSAFLYGEKLSEENGYRRGTIDKTLFIKKDKHDIILVQVYVDDIIFGSTKKSWCDDFEALMKSKFQMSSMGELTFFLGLQTASTPIETQKPLVKDEEASDVDVHLYRSMIGSLMYLTASRPDIMFAVCACSRFQGGGGVTPKSSHLSAVKRIFRYLKGKPKLGLWYPRVSSFDLESYSDSDYAGAKENQPLNDRFAEGMHAVPPPMTGNYMPTGPEIEIDYSQFTYGPKQTQPSESESQSSDFDTSESNISTEPSELVSEPVVNESNVECQPKVWSDAPIIEEYESDSEDECVSIPTKQQETPSFANQQVKTPRENVKSQFTHSQKPKVDKKDMGHGFTVRACFVCGSVNHLIRDCDFHEKRMARKAVLNNGWNNVQRVNKQNQFVPSAVLTRTGIIPVNTARVLRTDFSNQKLNTAKDYPHRALKNKGIVDSGCSRHMTGNKAYLAEFQDFNGGPVAFGGSKGYITGKGKIKTGKLDFEDVCFVKELQHFNLFSVSQMCDKKNKVLFTDSECLVLSPEFKLPDENQVLLKIPRQNNMYSFNLENIVPSGGLACLIAKATTDESNKWHRRLGHVNFKNLNKLVKGNLVRGLPSKIFQNDHTCVACQKGKQHKASCKAKSVSSISHSLQLLHMDLFGPTSVTPLFASMLVQPTEDEGAPSERPSEA
ncbi:putative ribonuclease H-like domain-containing protein [Tanacetum coccineum]